MKNSVQICQVTEAKLAGSLLLCDVNSFSSRIKANPIYSEWENTLCNFKDHIREEADLDFSNLNDHEKLSLYIYAYTKNDMCVFKRTVMRFFGWTSYKVRKLIKEINSERSKYYIENVPTFSESTGLLSGSGYTFNVA